MAKTTTPTPPSAATKEATQFAEVEYLCLRYGTTTDGKLLLVFKPVPEPMRPWTDSEDDSAVIALAASAFKQCHPGACYAIPSSPDRLVVQPKNCRWVRSCPDEVLECTLEARAVAFTAKKKQEQLAKRENAPTRGLEAPIRSLRRAYSLLPPQDRLAFETWVLFQLRRWD